MEFDDQAELHEEEEDEDEGEEDEEEEEEYTDDMGRLAPTAPSYNLVGINNNNGSPSSSAPPLDSNTKAVEAAATTTRSKYRECLKNHAVGIGGHALDGCGEFLPSGPDGSIDALKCAACSCHRNFHRRENGDSALAASAQFFHHHAALPPPRPPHLLHHFSPPARPQFATYYRSSAASATVGGYHRPPPPLALPSTGSDHEAEGASNPSGGGGRKRFRTKFTGEQRERMLELAERVGWRIQKQDEALVEQFCEETGLKRQVLKVWMHNHKHTHGPIIPNKTLPPN